MVKILHTADIHLDSPLKSLALRDERLREQVQVATRAAFTRLVDTALHEAVAAVLISGDLFDGSGRSAHTGAFLLQQLDRLQQANIAVFYIKGNHDADSPITGELELPETVHVFSGRGGKVQLPGQDIWIHGVSFGAKHAPESLLGKFSAPVAGAVNIALLHTSLAGAAGHDPYAPCTVAELTEMGFDYWALGHVHKRQVHCESPWVVMPGIPQGRDIGEHGPKSATMLHIDHRQTPCITLSEIPTSVAEFVLCTVDATEVQDDEALRKRIKEAFQECAAALVAQTGLLRLHLVGQSPHYWQVWRDQDVWSETAKQLAEDTGCLWVEKLVIELQPARSRPETHGADGAGSVSAIEALAQGMSAIQGEEGFALQAQSQVRAVITELPASCRALLLPDEQAQEALAQRLAASGATQVQVLMQALTHTSVHGAPE